jgi:hypothetical protein
VTKPIVKTLQQHRALEAAAKEANVLVMVEVHKRYDPIYIDARDRIRVMRGGEREGGRERRGGVGVACWRAGGLGIVNRFNSMLNLYPPLPLLTYSLTRLWVVSPTCTPTCPNQSTSFRHSKHGQEK